MHLQQSKAKSLETGGPQYWFEQVPPHIRGHLQREKTCPVILMTPYGPVETPFTAVDRDYKVMKGKIVGANAQHDRIQKGESRESIGEAIRRWFALRSGVDFETVEIEVTFDKQSRFILVPLEVKWRGRSRREVLPTVSLPLSFNSQHQSDLWKRQIAECRKSKPDALDWAASQFKRFVQQHADPKTVHVGEEDLLRLAGALDHLGLKLGPYLQKGFDCPESSFRFLQFPEYACPVEIKKRSQGIAYQVKHYPRLPRAVVFCLDHDVVHPPEHVDVLEITALARYFSS
jgi:hypothetical protein